MKTKIAIIGSGNIGWALKQLLKEDYDIKQGDITDGFDATDISQVKEFLDGVDAVISAGPFAVNKNIAQVASEESIGYFDLTEDVETTDFVKSLKSNNIIMPQCGLAPGAINICAAGMMEEFDTVNEVLMRVGALPRFTTNEMSYYLSWSTNGLINEYCNEADAIYEGRQVKVMPLEGAEKIVIDGESFEAFNTSGGCATMCETYQNKVQNLSYKTIRYPGHLNHMKFLFNDLHLKKNKEVLEKLFDKEVPRTKNDVIIFFVKVIGLIDGVLQEKTYLRKLNEQEHIASVLIDCAENPLNGKQWWLEADYPWQALGAAKEIYAAIRHEGGIETYMTGLPVHQDGSCNGLQHYAALGRDYDGAVAVNLIPSDKPQDVYSRVLAGGKISLRIGILVVGIAGTIGSLIGMFSGYVGGWIDEAVMRVTDVFLSVPDLVMALVIATSLGAGIDAAIIGITMVRWTGYARLIRSGVIAEKGKDYVTASRALGLHPNRIIFKHVLPNSYTATLVQATFDFGLAILFASWLLAASSLKMLRRSASVRASESLLLAAFS